MDDWISIKTGTLLRLVLTKVFCTVGSAIVWLGHLSEKQTIVNEVRYSICVQV